MTDWQREYVRQRAKELCEYCRLPDWLPPLEAFHIEHIIARQHGGSDDLDNLAFACHRCNAYKGPNLSGVDPLTDQIVNLFHPRRSVWEDHFRVAGFSVQGLTPVGRATVDLLQMNAPRRVERRTELVLAGWF
jgi:hypothetical protein